jgi:flagellar protein FliS
MSFTDQRAEFLRNRVLTASPAQRIVMIYDRLILDVMRARAAADVHDAGQHIDHAMQVVAELQSSLDFGAGSVADNLARLYAYVMNELVAARVGDLSRLDTIDNVVMPLRSAWTEAADTVASEAPTPVGAASGAWTG